MGRNTIQLMITSDSGEIVNVQVDPEEVVENIKALVEVEANIPLNDQVLSFDGKLLENNKKINEYGIKDNDLLYVQRRPQQRAAQQGQQPQNMQQEAEGFINQVRNNPQLFEQIMQQNPPLAEAILANNVDVVRRTLEQIAAAKRQREEEHMRRVRLLNEDPFNLEAQQAIEEEIRMERVNENMELAMEDTPEAFGRVIMLYIDSVVNSVPVKAFVDTGAQSTIMSVKCAERCGIMRLVDRRFQGIAKGVGTAKIIGKVHIAPIKIGNSHFPCSFTVLEGQDMDFILGLDMLRRHQCTLDLHNNQLVIGHEKVPFLQEKDLQEILKIDEAEDLPPSTTTTTTPPAHQTVIHPPVPLHSTNQPHPHPQAQAHPQPAAQQQPQAADVSEESIQQLMALGASRQEATVLLQRCRGNVELAASHLFGGGF